MEKVFAPYGEPKEVWLSNSIPYFGFAVFKDKRNAAVAVKACDGVVVCGCRIRVTYARPRRRGQGCRYHSNTMRCYQCGDNGHFYGDCPEITVGGDDRRKDHSGRYRSTRGDREKRDERDRDREWGYGRRTFYRSSSRR